MGDFNLSTPNLRGCETAWASRSTIQTGNPLSGAVTRFKSPGAVTPTHLHAYIESIVGAAMFCAEIVADADVTPTSSNVMPGTDVTTAIWTRSTGAGLWSAHVDDLVDTTDYLSASTTGVLELRGAGAALTNTRISSLSVRMATGSSVPGQTVRPFLNIGGSRYVGTTVAPTIPVAGAYTDTTYTWDLNPATGLPWTQAEANLFIQAVGTSSFGVEVVSMLGGTVRVMSLVLVVSSVTENRFGFYYVNNTFGLAAGWNRLALSGGVALVANTYYRVHLFNPLGGTKAYFNVPLLAAPHRTAQTAASSTTGEHRKGGTTTLAASSGIITANAMPTTASSVPFLLEYAGPTFATQSFPYPEVDSVAVYTGAPASAFGCELTTAAATAYSGVQLAVGWQGGLPDAPLIIRLRTGSFAGTVIATATLNPSDTTSGTIDQRVVQFAATVTPGAATKHYVTIESAASSGRGWLVAMLDSRSDIVTGTTASNVQTAGVNGTTDSAAPASSSVDARYDLPLALVVGPAAPGSFTATARAAA